MQLEPRHMVPNQITGTHLEARSRPHCLWALRSASYTASCTASNAHRARGDRSFMSTCPGAVSPTRPILFTTWTFQQTM